MKRIYSLCLIAIGASISAYGSPTFCSTLSTFQDYINAGACMVTGSGQSYTVSDFTYLGVSVLSPGQTASNINVSTTIGINGPSIVFTPTSAFGVSSILAATETILFGFDLTSNVANIGFASVNLSEQSALTGVLSAGLVAEEDCYGGALPGPSALLSLGHGGLACLGGGLSVGTQLQLSPGVNTNANSNIIFSGFSSSVDVLKELNLTAVGAGLTNGTATISSIGQSFTTETTTPEPSSFFMAAGGLALVLLGRAKTRKRKACAAQK